MKLKTSKMIKIENQVKNRRICYLDFKYTFESIILTLGKTAHKREKLILIGVMNIYTKVKTQLPLLAILNQYYFKPNAQIIFHVADRDYQRVKIASKSMNNHSEGFSNLKVLVT